MDTWCYDAINEGDSCDKCLEEMLCAGFVADKHAFADDMETFGFADRSE